MDKFLEKFKGNGKRSIENLVIFIVLVIIVIVVINSLYGSKTEIEDEVIVTNNKVTNSNDSLEDKLKSILMNMDGVGKVEVMVSYLSGTKEVPMYDVKETVTITSENDKSGGSRTTEEKSNEQNVVYDEVGSDKVPSIVQKLEPEVIGVIVVADGANNSLVKSNIIKAVEAVVDVPSHRIQVFSKQR